MSKQVPGQLDPTVKQALLRRAMESCADLATSPVLLL